MYVLLEQILKVSIWGILPIFLAFIVFMCALIVKCMKKEVIYHPLEEFYNKKKFYKTEKIYSKIDYLSEIYLFICVTFAIIPFVVILDIRYEPYIYQMIKNIDVVSSVVIGLTTMAITMAVVIILFDKRYYIVFSIREVLQKYKFTECLFIVIGSCILVSIATLSLLNKKIDSNFDVVRFIILEIATVYNVLGVTYILCVIVVIMFLEQKRELSLLGQLYRGFRLNRIDTLHFKTKKNWNKDVVDINVEYLLEQFLKICNCKKIGRLTDIEFVTTMDWHRKKWYRKASHRFVITMLCLLGVSVFIDWMTFKANCVKIVFFNILVTTIAIIFAYSNSKSFQSVIMRFYLDTWGYYFTTSNNKERFVPRYSIRKNAYSKYVIKMNSLNAFFYIWINYVDKKNSVLENEFKKVILYLEDVKNKNMITYFPVFTIGFFLFERDIKVVELKKIYDEIIVQNNKQFSFKRMMDSQIFYLTQRHQSELFGYRKKLNKYLQWIKK